MCRVFMCTVYHMCAVVCVVCMVVVRAFGVFMCAVYVHVHMCVCVVCLFVLCIICVLFLCMLYVWCVYVCGLCICLVCLCVLCV